MNLFLQVQILIPGKIPKKLNSIKKEFDHGGDLSHMEKLLICAAVVLN
jgi:hypothetical protein